MRINEEIKQNIWRIIIKNKYVSRKDRYKILQKLIQEREGFLLPEEVLQKINSYDRYVRDDTFFPKDRAGVKKEKEYQRDYPMHQFDYEMDKQLNFKLD